MQRVVQSLTLLVLENFRLWREIPSQWSVPIQSPPSPWKLITYFLSLWIAYSRHFIWMESNNMWTFVSAFFHSTNIFKAHPCYSMYFIHLDVWIVFHFIDKPHVIYLFISWRRCHTLMFSNYQHLSLSFFSLSKVICGHQGYWPIIFFLCIVFIWIWS